jgi:hypothetical protein
MRFDLAVCSLYSARNFALNGDACPKSQEGSAET